MFIHTSRAGDTIFCTVDAEPDGGDSSLSTTLRMTIEDARQLFSQLEKHVLDYRIEIDPHEAGGLVDEYQFERLAEDDALFASEPF
jgi:hypothetical protein